MEHLQQIVIKKCQKFHLSLKKLNKIDFYPFKLSKAKLAMTAHILYKKLIKKMLQLFQKKLLKK